MQTKVIEDPLLGLPPEYVKAGPSSTDYYLVSQEVATWPQAQYACQVKSGKLVESDSE